MCKRSIATERREAENLETEKDEGFGEGDQEEGISKVEPRTDMRTQARMEKGPSSQKGEKDDTEVGEPDREVIQDDMY